MIVDFYREVGYLPDAIINYLMLLGWSLDDKTEDFTREEMIKHFTLERVTKAPASFDPKKLWAFRGSPHAALAGQAEGGQDDPVPEGRGLVGDPPPCEVGPQLTRIVEAAGDRLKAAGDILAYADFFFIPDDKFVYDVKDVEKRLKKDGVKELLPKFKAKLRRLRRLQRRSARSDDAAFVEEQGIKIGDIVHAVRVAITGKGVGPGLYDCLELIGKPSCLARIDPALTLI